LVVQATPPRRHKERVVGISMSSARRANDPRGSQHQSEDHIMEPRIDLMANELGAKIAKRMYNVALAIQQSPLPQTIQDLVMLRASQINGCGFCIDYHTKDAAAAGETAVRLHLVAAWRESTVFTEAEQAALELAEEGTRIADAHHGVSDQTWAQVRKHYDDDQIVALVSLIAMINASNRLNVIVRNPGGSYEPGMFASIAS
jgi:AhpD family alkylhydroperoxidase